jgi:hypothetical protein
VAYQTGEHALQNRDTFLKVSAYLDLDFVRSLFNPYMTRETFTNGQFTTQVSS